MIRLILWCNLLLPFCAVAQDTIRLPLREIDLRVIRYGHPDSPVLLYNMHDNENTSALAGRVLSSKSGGEYFELQHTGKRMLSFQAGRDSVHIDPNRIYTDAGIWQQLEKNKKRDSTLFRSIAVWRDSLLLLLKLPERKIVIALHNNTNHQYSFKSYVSGGEYDLEAEAVYCGLYKDEDDFFFITDPELMRLLSGDRYHVVLQHNRLMTDDGSLSVYCGQRHIPYINVEAEHGHFFRQMKMLLFALRKLDHPEKPSSD